MKLGRNSPCICGSGRKAKRCHGRSPRVLAALGRFCSMYRLTVRHPFRHRILRLIRWPFRKLWRILLYAGVRRVH